jgi:hypothetical protein
LLKVLHIVVGNQMLYLIFTLRMLFHQEGNQLASYQLYSCLVRGR